MKKIETSECLLFLAAHYAQNNIDTDAEDWVLTNKYKNFHGFTCRDFHHKKMNIDAIVVAEIKDDKYNLSVIEDATFKIFLEEMARHPLYYYATVISNDGLVFYFEHTMTFDATGVLEKNIQKQKTYLIKKLETIFKPKDIMNIEGTMTFIFFNHQTEDVIRLLEEHKISFNANLYPLLDKDKYQPFHINVDLCKYRFLEDNKLPQEQIIDKLCSLVSKEEISIEDYAHVKNLLKKVPEEEMNSIEILLMGFSSSNDKLLNTIIQQERARKEVKNLWKKIYQNEAKKNS